MALQRMRCALMRAMATTTSLCPTPCTLLQRLLQLQRRLQASWALLRLRLLRRAPPAGATSSAPMRTQMQERCPMLLRRLARTQSTGSALTALSRLPWLLECCSLCPQQPEWRLPLCLREPQSLSLW